MFRKKKHTKWIPLGINTHGYQHYLVMVRKNINTGELFFKSKKIQRQYYYGAFMPHDLVDVKKQWETVVSEDFR